MRLKTFQADSMAQAMKLVRDQLGDDAIIVATHEEGGSHGVRVTAAVEDEQIDAGWPREHDAEFDIIDHVYEALDYHGVPAALAERLINSASQLAAAEATLALAGALDACFTFHPLPRTVAKAPLLFFGPPGSGKTVSIAKLAAGAVLNGAPVTLITTDTVRAGAVAQIKTYAERLGVTVYQAANAIALIGCVDRCPAGHLVMIDTTGTNPYSEEDMARLAEFADALTVEPVLVMSAGRHPSESAELAQAFGPIGARRLLATSLDMARRLGGVLAAADAARLAFCDVSPSPNLADGLKAINPVSLARLLLPGSQAGSDGRYVGDRANMEATGSR